MPFPFFHFLIYPAIDNFIVFVYCIMEIWKDVVGYEGFYQVSDQGKVRSLERVTLRRNGRPHTTPASILKFRKRSNGYYGVCLYKDKIGVTHSIHRLVAIAFIPNPNNYGLVNHKRGIITDNRVSEIEWCNHQYNQEHANKVLRVYDARKKMVRIKEISTGKETIARSIKEAAILIKGSRCAIRNVLDGKYGHHKHHTFQEV